MLLTYFQNYLIKNTIYNIEKNIRFNLYIVLKVKILDN